MDLTKETKGKGKVLGKRHQGSWKKKLEKRKKKMERMKAKMVKLKANVKRMKNEKRKAKEDLESKKREFAVIKEANRLVAEDNASIQLCLDVMLITMAEDGDLVVGADHLSRSFR